MFGITCSFDVDDCRSRYDMASGGRTCILTVQLSAAVRQREGIIRGARSNGLYTYIRLILTAYEYDRVSNFVVESALYLVPFLLLFLDL